MNIFSKETFQGVKILKALEDEKNPQSLQTIFQSAVWRNRRSHETARRGFVSGFTRRRHLAATSHPLSRINPVKRIHVGINQLAMLINRFFIEIVMVILELFSPFRRFIPPKGPTRVKNIVNPANTPIKLTNKRLCKHKTLPTAWNFTRESMNNLISFGWSRSKKPESRKKFHCTSEFIILAFMDAHETTTLPFRHSVKHVCLEKIAKEF